MPSVTPKFDRTTSPRTVAADRVSASLAEEVASCAVALIMEIWGGRGNPKYDYIDQRVMELGDYCYPGNPEMLDATRMIRDIQELHENGVTEALIDWVENDMGWDANPEQLALRFFPSPRRERTQGNRTYVNEARDGLLYWLCNLRVGSRRADQRALYWSTGNGVSVEPALATKIYLRWPLAEKLPLDIPEKDLRPVARRIDPDFADSLSDDVKSLLPSFGFNRPEKDERPTYDDPEVEVALTQMLRIDLEDTVESESGQTVLRGVLSHPPIIPDHAAFRRVIADAKAQGHITDERAEFFETSFKRACAAAREAFKRSKAKTLANRQKFAAKTYTDTLADLII